MNKLLTEDPELNCLFIKFIERCHMLININDMVDLDKVNENTDDCNSSTDDIQSCDCKYIQDYAFKYRNDQKSKKYDITMDDYKTQYHQDALKRMKFDGSSSFVSRILNINQCELYNHDSKLIIGDRTSDT